MKVLSSLSRHNSLVAMFILLAQVAVFIVSSVPDALAAVPFADFDLDGSIVIQEALDDTDDDDADSFIEHGTTQYCAEWNGFSRNLVQVFELRNSGGSAINLQVRLLSSSGVASTATPLTIPSMQQFDFIVNSAAGFTADAYGLVCARVTNSIADSLDAQVSTYRLGGDGFELDGFRLGFSVPASSGRTGPQFVGYNHIFPTLDPTELGNFAAGFVQISNLEATTESGELVYYDQEGFELRRTPVALPSFGRLDLDTHSVGPNTVGRVEWIPADPDKRFRVVLNRYFYDSNASGSLVSAVAIPATRGYGKLAGTTFSLSNRITVLELVNALNVETTVQAVVALAEGTPATTQPAPVVLPPRATRHVVLNSFLPANSLGRVTFEANAEGAVIGTVYEYGLKQTAGLSFASNAGVIPPVAAKQLVSYNNFLGGCDLRLANLSVSPETAELRMTRFDGTNIPLNDVIVPAGGGVVVDICSADTQPGYGEISVNVASKTVTAELVRRSRSSDAEFRLAAKPRGRYETWLEVTPSTLVLEAGSGTPGSFIVTNISPLGGTAKNIQAVLDPSLNDVTVAPNQCPVLAIAQSCQIVVTPGAGVHPAAPVIIAADNSLPETVEVAVVIAPSISITGPVQQARVVPVSGAPLSLEVTVGAGNFSNATEITVTNSAACPNLMVDASACEDVAAGDSCNLLLSSNNPFAPCTITIGGSNTTNSPTTRIAFSYLGGIVFEESGGSGKVIIDASQGFTSQWTAIGALVGANSLTDGQANTNAIVANPSCTGFPPQCAALRCRNISADWYLPANSELDAAFTTLCPEAAAPCSFGAFEGSDSYLSSTEIDFLAVLGQILAGNQVVQAKGTASLGRCMRGF